MDTNNLNSRTKRVLKRGPIPSRKVSAHSRKPKPLTHSTAIKPKGSVWGAKAKTTLKNGKLAPSPRRCLSSKVIHRVLKKRTKKGPSFESRRTLTNSKELPKDPVTMAMKGSTGGEGSLHDTTSTSCTPAETPTNETLSCTNSSIPQSEIESRMGEASLQPVDEEPITDESQSVNMRVNKNPRKSPVSAEVLSKAEDDLANTDLGRQDSNSLSLEDFLKMRDDKNKRTTLAMRCRKKMRNNMALDRANILKGELVRDASVQIQSSESLFGKPLMEHADSDEYLQDVGILAELVKKATLDFFKDAGTVKCALKQNPLEKEDREHTQVAKVGSKKLTYRATPRSTRRLRPRRVRSKSYQETRMQFSSSTSDLFLHHSNSKYHLSCEKFEESSLLVKERNAHGMNTKPKVDMIRNGRFSTSIQMGSNKRITNINCKPNKLTRASIEETHHDSSTSNADVTGLGAIIAESRRLAQESASSSCKRFKRCCLCPSGGARSTSSKRSHGSQSFSSQSSRVITRGGEAAAPKSNFPQSHLTYAPVSKPTNSKPRRSVASKSLTRNRATQTGKESTSEMESNTEPLVNLSRTICSGDTTSEWDNVSTQTKSSSGKQGKFESLSHIAQSNDAQSTGVISEDLPTYLDPSDAWAFYNSTKIRLPYMEIDGIFDGTPFASTTKKTNYSKQVTSKSIQVNLQHQTDANSHDGDIQTWETKYEPSPIESLSQRAIGPMLAEREAKGPMELLPEKDKGMPEETDPMPKIEVKPRDLIQDHVVNETRQEQKTICKPPDPKATTVKPQPRSNPVTRKSLSRLTRVYNREDNIIGTDSDQGVQRPRNSSGASTRTSKGPIDSKGSVDQSSSQNLPGYLRPTSTSCRRYQQTQIEIQERKQFEGEPSRYMALPQKKTVQWPDKRRRVVCSRRRSSILVKGSNSRLGCNSCRRHLTGSSETDTSTKSCSSNQITGGTRKSISFSLKNSNIVKKTRSRQEDEQITMFTRQMSGNDDKRSHDLESTISSIGSKESDQSRIPFFKKWLKSVSQVLNPWKKLIIKPDMVNASCSNTNLIRLPNLLLQNRSVHKLSPKAKLPHKW